MHSSNIYTIYSNIFILKFDIINLNDFDLKLILEH